jgi:integrase/recombinase XerD
MLSDEKITAYLQFLKVEKERSQNTIENYRRDLMKYVHFLQEEGVEEWQDVSRFDVTSFLQGMKDSGKSNATIARMVSSLKQFSIFLLQTQVITSDPLLAIQPPKAVQEPPVILTVEQINDLFSSIDVSTPFGLRDRAIMELMYATGIKVSELLDLKLENFHAALQFIQTTGNYGKERIIPVADVALEWLNRYLNEVRPLLIKQETDYIFVNHHGKKMTRQGLWKNLHQIFLDEGIDSDVTPLTLRHSFATHLLENGAELQVVQELMGHETISTTQVYIKHSKKRLTESYNEFFPRNNKRG